MDFYKVDVKVDELNFDDDRALLREFKIQGQEASEQFYNNSGKEDYIFISSTKEGKLSLGIIFKSKVNLDIVSDYLKEINITPRVVDITKSTLTFVSQALTKADRGGFVLDDLEILKSFGIDEISERYGRLEFGESFLDDSLTKEDITNIAKELLISDSLLPELNRIYKGQARVKIEGHPVHYLVVENDRERRKATTRAILSALYSNGRIKDTRYCFLNFNDSSKEDPSSYEALYESSKNGAIIIRYEAENGGEGELGPRGMESLKNICECAYKYRNKVLTMFCLPSGREALKEQIASNIKTMALVEIRNDLIDLAKANKYLRALCKKGSVKPDKSLLYGESYNGQGFVVKEIEERFYNWYDEKLRKCSYPQYNKSSTAKEVIADSKPRGNAYYRLQELIGLKEAKNMIDNAINYFKAQRLFEERGITSSRPNMHMVFTGNPGTAKTTVARLFAEIMRDNGILESGELYEVGRADLVGKYLGHTAPMVKKAFEKAKGSVLFIDEAYSLVDDKDGLYGDEAINAIVQEMENNRQDTIVIFAGYPDKMEGFLNKNPGLRSRVSFHINFEDYSANELCDISRLVASDIGLTLDDGAIEKLGIIFQEARQKSDFGNGRFARNLIEKAKMAQAKRLMSMDYTKLSNKEICTIIADDIEDGKNANTPKRAIGFVS